jgi:hypothetical protein
MKQTGHRSVQMVRRYIRDGSLFRRRGFHRINCRPLDSTSLPLGGEQANTGAWTPACQERGDRKPDVITAH